MQVRYLIFNETSQNKMPASRLIHFSIKDPDHKISVFRTYARVILTISKRLYSESSILIINRMGFSRRIGSIREHLLNGMVELLCCLVALICLLLDRCFLKLLNLLLNATYSLLDKCNLLAYKLSLCIGRIGRVLLACSSHAMQLLWRNNLSLDRMLEMLFD